MQRSHPPEDSEIDTRNPEYLPVSQKRLAIRLRHALKEGGIDIPSGLLLKELSQFIIDEKTELREMVGKVVGTLVEREEHVSGEKLERLAYIVEHVYEDDDGEVRVCFGDEGMGPP